MEIILKRSHNPKKKFDAVINGNKTISFGADGYSDYTINQDDERKDNYIKRHSNENWSKSNIVSPAWMSRFLLWEKKTLPDAVRTANNKYKDVKFKLQY